MRSRIGSSSRHFRAGGSDGVSSSCAVLCATCCIMLLRSLPAAGTPAASWHNIPGPPGKPTTSASYARKRDGVRAVRVRAQKRRCVLLPNFSAQCSQDGWCIAWAHNFHPHFRMKSCKSARPELHPPSNWHCQESRAHILARPHLLVLSSSLIFASLFRSSASLGEMCGCLCPCPALARPSPARPRRVRA